MTTFEVELKKKHNEKILANADRVYKHWLDLGNTPEVCAQRKAVYLKINLIK